MSQSMAVSPRLRFGRLSIVEGDTRVNYRLSA